MCGQRVDKSRKIKEKYSENGKMQKLLKSSKTPINTWLLIDFIGFSF